MNVVITEAQAERMADFMVWRRLYTDNAYVNAADADSQANREDEIATEVWREIEAKYTIS
jgi:hypothetical protein